MRHIHPLKRIVELQKKGIPAGIYSACSANGLVIEACMERALKESDPVLIEATANQVNQYGGYTGMNPAGFREFVLSIAEKTGFPQDKIILGGDHLGPLTWKDLPAEKAMEEAKELIRQFILAGFTKIHIDTSMRLGDDDPQRKLDTAVIAERGAVLGEAADKAYKELIVSVVTEEVIQPVYVIGSEVPVPGGSQDEDGKLQITRAADFKETVKVFKEAFQRHNLYNIWENVIGVVVQPGVEFGDDAVHEYNRTAAMELSDSLSEFPNLVFEGHSTDYQTAGAFKAMVEDGIAILKVGPALTFALREALFALNHIENELFADRQDISLSRFTDVLEGEMLKKPENWIKHYHGSGGKLRLARKYSFSDRCRYYLPVPEVRESMNRMINNLKTVEIPLSLLSQYLPVQYAKVRNRQLANNPESLVKDRIANCIDEYLYGTKPQEVY